MLFWILLIAMILLALYGVAVFLFGNDGSEFDVAMMSLVMAFIPSILVVVTWGSHANDLGTIEAQHEVISVYEQRVERLTDRLENFGYHRSDAKFLLNADSPVASVVESLTDAESQLALAEAEKAKAIRSIEQRRRGPMSGVITMVGDYK